MSTKIIKIIRPRTGSLVFPDHVEIVNRFNILYDFSGHKPDLEGKIQICFRYGFDRPVLSVLGFMIYEFRNHINRWRYYAIHVVEQRGTVIDMFVTF